MSVLFGHPGASPNSHHAALAHWKAGRLAALVTPWFPSRLELAAVKTVLPEAALRLERRRFEPLAEAPKIQDRLGEWSRLWRSWRGRGGEGLSYEANDWLMNTMGRACARAGVSAVHAYEDCALRQFETAKSRGHACLYDMPIGYYSAWEKEEAELSRRYADWLPAGEPLAGRWVRPGQKQREMELADLVFAPSAFVRETILRFHPNKKVALIPYGVDADFWRPATVPRSRDSELRFLYAGQISIRKGMPVLFDAWRRAALPDAKLVLVGSWQLAEHRRAALPPGVEYHPHCSPVELRAHYQGADVFLFPSLFDGFGLVLLEAMACGLPVVATEVTAAPDILDQSTGRIIRSGRVEDLVETLARLAQDRDGLSAMKAAARLRAETFLWENYRRAVSAACEEFV